MTTVVVVRKNGQAAIAADSLVTFGDTRLLHGYEANDKLFKSGDPWIGLSATTAQFAVMRRALNVVRPYDVKLHSRGGAMLARHDKARTAREIAELGVRAGCEFDKNSSGPVRSHTIKLKEA